jgi:hypothetical protein
MFTGALFIIAQTWKKPRRPLVGECDIPRQWYIIQCFKKMSYQVIERHGET